MSLPIIQGLERQLALLAIKSLHLPGVGLQCLEGKWRSQLEELGEDLGGEDEPDETLVGLADQLPLVQLTLPVEVLVVLHHTHEGKLGFSQG